MGRIRFHMRVIGGDSVLRAAYCDEPLLLPGYYPLAQILAVRAAMPRRLCVENNEKCAVVRVK